MPSDLLENMLKVLEIRETSKLLAHEQTISKNVKRLKQGMLNIGHLVDPVIVDDKSGTVLDGNHRLKVLAVIECPLVACQVVDYENPSITLGTWLPVFKDNIRDMLKDVVFEKVSLSEGQKAINDLKAPYLFHNQKEESCYLLNPGNYKLFEMIEEQNYLNSLLSEASVTYIPDHESKTYAENGYTVLHRRSYTKKEIVAAAKDHKPFPPKSTRHMIPGRIIRLNMKLGWLHQDKERAYQSMAEMLNLRAYNGNVRKYFEPVIVIY